MILTATELLMRMVMMHMVTVPTLTTVTSGMNRPQ